MSLAAKLGWSCGEAILNASALAQVSTREVRRSEEASLDFTLSALSGTLDSSARAGAVQRNDEGIWTVIMPPCTRSWRIGGLLLLRGSTVTRSEG